MDFLNQLLRRHQSKINGQPGEIPASTMPRPTEKQIQSAEDPAAIQGVYSVADDTRLNALLSQLEVTDWQIAKAATIALGELGDTRAVRPLIDSLSHSHPDVRWGACWALTKLGDQPGGTENAAAALPQLRILLSDSHWQIRASAADALGVLGDEHAVDLLINLLHDPEEHVVTSTVEALGKLGEGRAIPPLIACLKRGHWAVRMFASRALTVLTDQDLGEDASAWEHWFATHVGGKSEAQTSDAAELLCSGDQATRLRTAQQLAAGGGEGAIWGYVFLALLAYSDEREHARQMVVAGGRASIAPIAYALVTADTSYDAAELTRSLTPHVADIRYEVEAFIVQHSEEADAWLGLGNLNFVHSSFQPALACFEQAKHLGSKSEHLTSMLYQLQIPAYAPKLRGMDLLRLRFTIAASTRSKLDALHDF